MKAILSALIVLLVATTFQMSSSAQKPPPKPEFKDAPITDLLMWARETIGCGFIYEAGDLINPDTAKVYTITASQIQPESKSERTLLLFELLKKVGLVAFEVGGLPGPTYELMHGKDAASSATVLTEISQLDGHYYAALAIRLHRASPTEVASRIKKILTPGASNLEVIESTHTLIITDFADRIRQAFEISVAVDVPTARADDTIVADFAPVNTVAAKLVAALERLRGKDQIWKATVNTNANVVLASGPRAEVEMLMTHMKQIDAFPQKPEYSETTSSVKLLYVTASDAVRTLREMFAPQISAGSVQLGAMESSRKIVFRGSAYDLQILKQNLKAIDVQPIGRAKNE